MKKGILFILSLFLTFYVATAIETWGVSKNRKNVTDFKVVTMPRQTTTAVPTATIDPNIFVKASVDKPEAYLNEQIILKYDLYTRYDTRYEGFVKEGRLRGFWLEYKETDKNVPRETIQYEGRKFVKATIREIILSPIAPGKYTIEPGAVRVSVVKESGERQEMQLKAKPIEIIAKDLTGTEENKGQKKTGASIFPAEESNDIQSSPNFNDGKPGLMILLDVSGSMLAEDLQPGNRLAVAKNALKTFMNAKPNIRIGVKVFAKEVVTVAPLTDGTKKSLQEIENVQVGMVKDGTAIGDALLAGVKELKKNPARKNIIVLLSDGANNAGHIDPLTAADFSKQDNIAIYAIGIGKDGLVPFPINDPVLGKRYVNAEVNVDDETLGEIASVTGGKFFKVVDANQLKDAFDFIGIVLTRIYKESASNRL